MKLSCLPSIIIFIIACSGSQLVAVSSGLGQSASSVLADKAYQAFDKENFKEAAILFEQAFRIATPTDSIGRYYYDAACAFSQIHDTSRAVFHLANSYAYFKQMKRTPVTTSHLIHDMDLKTLWGSEQFSTFVTTHFSKEEGLKILEETKMKEISYEELSKMITRQINEGNKNVIIENAIIYWKKASNGKYIFNEPDLPIPPFTTRWDVIIRFSNCEFQMHFNLTRRIEFFGDARGHQTLQTFYFMYCDFHGQFRINMIDLYAGPEIGHCRFFDCFEPLFNVVNPNLSWNSDINYNVYHNKFTSVRFITFSNFPINLNISENEASDSSDIHIEANNVNNLLFQDNTFKGNSVFIVGKSVENVNVENDTVNNLILAGTTINSKFDFRNTAINGKFLMRKSVFTDLSISNIQWGQVSNGRLGIPSSFVRTDIDLNEHYDKNIGKNLTSITGDASVDIAEEGNFTELLGVYSMFLKLYKEKNDLESYNSCYIAIKKLQSKRLKILYDSGKSFESYFRWKLSQLLEFYVRFGTDPARAIVISLYIIFFFGVFFFFFPSDWDTTSKSKLVMNFRDFIGKNEKGYARPLLYLTGGFCLSLINALTLSLNAFITLGFGNIPTHGLARYFCVIEGFIGWFLLSIFTVALINQVL